MEKLCATCGRVIEWRKKWAKNWDEIKYCSDRCRKNKPHDDFESRLLAALSARPRGTSIESTEVLTANECEEPASIERARAAARRLFASGRVLILQDARAVDPSTARGPFQVKLKG